MVQWLVGLVDHELMTRGLLMGWLGWVWIGFHTIDIPFFLMTKACPRKLTQHDYTSTRMIGHMQRQPLSKVESGN